MVIVISLDFKLAEQPFDFERLPAFAVLSGLGDISGIGTVSSFLKKNGNQVIGRFEYGGANQKLNSLDGGSCESLSVETLDQLLDFFFLSEEDLR